MATSLPAPPSPPLPPLRSHWDRLPAELHAMVVARAGPLTRLSIGWVDRIDVRQLAPEAWVGSPPPPQDAASAAPAGAEAQAAPLAPQLERSASASSASSEASIQGPSARHKALLAALWSEVLTLDWPGDLTLLPPAAWLPLPVYWHVHSRGMFDRLQLLPWASPEGLAHAAARCRLADQLDWSEPQLLCELAVDSGAVWLLRVLVSGQDGGVPPSDVELRLDHVNRAAMNGHLGMLVLLDEYLGHLCWPKSVMDHAASGGHLHILEWLHEHRTEGCSAFAMDWAATNGHLTTVQWLHATRTEGCTKFAMDLACNNGHLATVKWLHEHRTEGCSQHAMTWAAKNGHLAIVIWLHLHRTESCDGSALTSAARNGHLRVVDFLLHHVAGVDWDLEQAFKEAMEAQHEDVCRAVFEFAKRRAGQ